MYEYYKKKTNYSDNELEKIRYGLTSIYLTFSKILFILCISIYLNFFKEVVIFMICFNIIRTFAFGLHATKSWICWITSTIAFIFIPLMCKHIELNTFLIEAICLINTLLICKNSPADTKKKPIVNRKRRKIYNILSTFVAIIYSIAAIYIKNNFIVNCFIFALILENIMISPLTYKIFKMPYNNYVEFLKKHPDFTY